MNQFIFPVFLLLVLTLSSTGCARFMELRDRYWPSGPSEYEMEMPRKDIDRIEKRLAENIYPMDTQLSSLLRRLSVRDDYPSLQWKENLAQSFTWLNGITVLDASENILSRYPEEGIKQLDFDPLFPRALDLPLGRTMLELEDTPLGPEIILASAVYQDFRIDGLIAVHFDPRSFIADSNDPDDIIMICKDRVVWPGQYQDLQEKLENVHWSELTRKKIRGRVKLDNRDFFWFARAVGQDWIIYLLKVH